MACTCQLCTIMQLSVLEFSKLVEKFELARKTEPALSYNISEPGSGGTFAAPPFLSLYKVKINFCCLHGTHYCIEIESFYATV